MKRRILATALVGLGTLAVRADNTINLVDRTDFRSQFFADSTQGQDNNQFDENYLRVDFKGNVFENVDYRLRLRLDKTSAKDNLKGISDFANYAYVQPKLNDNFSVKIGKLWTYQAGWEEDNSSSDTYLFSGIDNVVNNYALGVNPTISLDKQNNIQVILTNSDVAYPGTTTERYLDYGIAYQGMVADVIQPMLSFTVMPQTGWSKGSMIGAAGIKVDPAPVGGELDF
ncbi:MAG TPA: porin, partial [Fibrobacteria bacterium]|nr:porin [Fibrobacteria bacterium]